MKPVDDLGLPGAIGEAGEFDGGDTAAILGTVVSLQEQEELPTKLLNHITVHAGGIPRRHPDITKWYGQPDRFSRDQLTPVICAGVRLAREINVDDIFEQHQAKKFLTAWNTRGNGQMDLPKKFPDITGPEIWALWLRYKKPWWAFLFVWLLDIETLVGSIIWRWFKKPGDRVCRNHMLVLATGRLVYPTLTMRIADWITDWADLTMRWQGHCHDTREYDTSPLFQRFVR